MSPCETAFANKETPVPEIGRWATHRWQTNQRYYIAEVMQDLWGNWLLRRSWGGLGSRRGSNLTVPAESYEQALMLLADTAKRRRARGYIRAE